MGRNHDEEVDKEIRFNRPRPETLRMKVRDAVKECLDFWVKTNAEGGYFDLEQGIADAVFEALEITEVEQDKYYNVRPTDESGNS